MGAEGWLQYVEKLGAMGGVLMLMALVSIKGGRWLGDNVFRPLVESQLETMKSIRISHRQQAKTLRKIERGQREISKRLPEVCPYHSTKEVSKNET